MATGAQTWSTSAASNNSVDSSVNWAEGMAPSAVNNSARAEMASVAMHIGDNSGTLATSGTTAAYTVTSKQVSTALVDGYTIMARMHVANDASATLNVDGAGAKAIHLYAGTPVSGGEFLTGSIQRFTYTASSTSWVLNNYRPASISSLLAADGTVGSPSFAFTNDTDCGLYRIGANDIGFTVGGTKVTEWTTAGMAITGALSFAAATLTSSLTVGTATLLSSNLTVSGVATLSSSLTVNGPTMFNNTALVLGAATMASSLTVGKGTLVSSALTVAGAATMQSSMEVTGTTRFAGATTFANTATHSSSIVAAAASFSGTVTASGALNVSGAETVSGVLTVNNDANVSGEMDANGFSGNYVDGNMVANQGDMESYSSTNLIVSPSQVVYHPGVAKAWGLISSGAGVSAGFNTNSASSGGTGIYNVSFSSGLSGSSYAICITPQGGSPSVCWTITSQSASGFTVSFRNVSGSNTNTAFCFSVFGDF